MAMKQFPHHLYSITVDADHYIYTPHTSIGMHIINAKTTKMHLIFMVGYA